MVDLIFATVRKIVPWVSRRMLAKSVSNFLPVSPLRVATKPCCCGDGLLGMVMPSWAATLRSVSSSAAWPLIRCWPAVLTAGMVPFWSASCPTGYSQSPAARTLTTKSRSASVSGPVDVLAITRFGALDVVCTPITAGYASAASVKVNAPATKSVPAFRAMRIEPPGGAAARSGELRRAAW